VYSPIAARLLVGTSTALQSRHMPPIAPTFTPLEWRTLAHACQSVAETERKRAADTGAKYFERSAETFDRLAKRCLEMARPDLG
jgi:hypothetical protein